MKPGLLDILACPICKHYPLILRIFKWEIGEEIFKLASQEIPDPLATPQTESFQALFVKDEGRPVIEVKEKDDELIICDELVREEHDLNTYLELLLPKRETIDFILDDTGKSQKIIDLIKGKSFPLFEKVLKRKGQTSSKEQYSAIKPELHLMNWYLFRTEIEEGIMICEQCKRWYPIQETIPQMLPDDLRDEKQEKSLLNKWKTKMPKQVLESGLPYHL